MNIRGLFKGISPLVGDAGVSIEVFADLIQQLNKCWRKGRTMFSWIPNAYIKYPCTYEGLRAAQMSVERGGPSQYHVVFLTEPGRGRLCRYSGLQSPSICLPIYRST